MRGHQNTSYQIAQNVPIPDKTDVLECKHSIIGKHSVLITLHVCIWCIM